MKTSKAYEEAHAKSGEAIRAFQKIQNDYRARKIGDAEYLAGRKAYELAMSDYDKAFAAESELGA